MKEVLRKYYKNTQSETHIGHIIPSYSQPGFRTKAIGSVKDIYINLCHIPQNRSEGLSDAILTTN